MAKSRKPTCRRTPKKIYKFVIQEESMSIDLMTLNMWGKCSHCEGELVLQLDMTDVIRMANDTKPESKNSN